MDLICSQIQIKNVDFLTFLVFDSIWIQSHMQPTSDQSKILHYLIFCSVYVMGC